MLVNITNFQNNPRYFLLEKNVLRRKCAYRNYFNSLIFFYSIEVKYCYLKIFLKYFIVIIVLQSANYVADPVNGFRVAATNLPVAPGPVAIPDSPEVAEAKAKHFALSAEAAAKAAANPE